MKYCWLSCCFFTCFVYYMYCARQNDQLHMYKLWTAVKNNHQNHIHMYNKGNVNDLKRTFSNYLYQVSCTCTCSVYTNLIAWLPTNNGCVKMIVTTVSWSLGVVHKLAPKSDWCSAGRQPASSKWTKVLLLAQGSTCNVCCSKITNPWFDKHVC